MEFDGFGFLRPMMVVVDIQNPPERDVEDGWADANSQLIRQRGQSLEAKNFNWMHGKESPLEHYEINPKSHTPTKTPRKNLVVSRRFQTSRSSLNPRSLLNEIRRGRLSGIRDPLSVLDSNIRLPPIKTKSAAEMGASVNWKKNEKIERGSIGLNDNPLGIKPWTIPKLTRRDIAQYRNSFAHNVCADLLFEGFHNSFAEIFAMVRQNKSDRDQSAPNDELRNISLLEHSPRKLERIKKTLMESESIERQFKLFPERFKPLEEAIVRRSTILGSARGSACRGSGFEADLLTADSRKEVTESLVSESVWQHNYAFKGHKHPYMRMYELRYSTAVFFSRQDDFWLAHYFFESANRLALLIPGEQSQKKYAECCRAYGRSMENHGLYEEAAKRMEEYLRLSQENKWIGLDGKPMEKDACVQLSRIYGSLASKLMKLTSDIEGEKNPKEQALVYYHKSFNMAFLAGERKAENIASFKLGLALLYMNRPSLSLAYLEVYYHFCQVSANEFGMGKVLEALARAMHEERDYKLALRYLSKCEEITLKKRKQAIQAQATSQWKSDNVQKFIDNIRYQMLENTFARCSRLMGSIHDDSRDYSKAEPYLQSSYFVARSLSDKHENSYKASRVQYGIANAHKLYEDMEKLFAHSLSDFKKKLINAKLVVAWKLDRISGFCSPADNESDFDNWVEEYEALEVEGGFESLKPTEKPAAGPGKSTKPKEAPAEEGEEAEGTPDGQTTIVSVESVDSTQRSRISQAKFVAREKQRQSRASGRNLENIKGVKGAAIPVPERPQEIRWSELQLVPAWHRELDINFLPEYGLIGSCIEAGFSPFAVPEEEEEEELETSIEVTFEEEDEEGDGEGEEEGGVEGEGEERELKSDQEMEDTVPIVIDVEDENKKE